MLTDDQGTKCRRNIAENFTCLSRAHERYRQTDRRQTDGRATAYSEMNVNVSSRLLKSQFVSVRVGLSIRTLKVAFHDRFSPSGTEVTTSQK